MKKLLSVAALLTLPVLLLFVGSWTGARAQENQAAPQGIEARVASLENELALEKRRHDETRALLEQTLSYLDKQSKAAQTLLGVLDESEKQGFAMGENWGSRATLLAGFRAYWGGQQGLPKLPTAPPPKPEAPARPTRTKPPARQ